jgi:hypothetical protein
MGLFSVLSKRMKDLKNLLGGTFSTFTTLAYTSPSTFPFPVY